MSVDAAKHQRILLVYLVFVFLLSCNNEKGATYDIVLKDSIVFDLPHDISRENWNIIDGDSTVYIFPLILGDKSIKICNAAGKRIDSISLKKIFETKGPIGRVFLKNRDSIFAMTYYTNRIFLINRYGDVLAESKLLDSVSPQLDYTTVPFQYGQLFYHDHFLFNLNLKNIDNPDFSPQEDIREFFKIKRESPYLIYYPNPFTDSNQNKPVFQLHSFEKRFVQDGFAGTDFYKIIQIDNDTVVLINNLTDTIYKIAGMPMTVVQAKQVVSDYSDIKHIPLHADSFNQDAINHILLSKGYIRRVLHDPYRNLYYISVFHSQPKEKGDISQVLPNWSLIILDKDLNKLGEHFFPKDTYHSTSLLIHEKGLLVQRDVSRKISPKPIFDLYVPEKK